MMLVEALSRALRTRRLVAATSLSAWVNVVVLAWVLMARGQWRPDEGLGRTVPRMLLAAVLTAFGVIHSTDPRGGVYLPWNLEGLRAAISWQLTAAYALLALLLGLLATLWPAANGLACGEEDPA